MLEQDSTTVSKTQELVDTKGQYIGAPITNNYAHFAPKMVEQGFSVLPIIPGDKYPAIPTFSNEADGTKTISWRPLYNWQTGFPLLDEVTAGMMQDSSVGIC